MKKQLQTGIVLIALTAMLSTPVFAASILTAETFASASATRKQWVADAYAPEEFDFYGGQLYLAIGKSGYTKNRDEAHRDKRYALQGMKLPVQAPSSNTWTATVKINIDDFWFSSKDVRKRAEFRIDLQDRQGNPITPSPAIAIIKGGTGAPYANFVNPVEKSGWETSSYFVDQTKKEKPVPLEQGWHMLLIQSVDGVLTYSIDGKKIGSAELSSKDLYPTHMALNAQNYNRPYVLNFDNCYLYDGIYRYKTEKKQSAENT